jgi:hypothetical protein
MREVPGHRREHCEQTTAFPGEAAAWDLLSLVRYEPRGSAGM